MLPLHSLSLSSAGRFVLETAAGLGQPEKGTNPLWVHTAFDDIRDPVTQSIFNGTAGNDTFLGGSDDDTFNMAQGGNDTVKGKAGDDTFNFGAAFTAADKIDGGVDDGGPNIDTRDALFLNGDYSAGVVFGATTLQNVESINLSAGHSYSFTSNDNTVAAGALMHVREVLSFGPGDNVTFNGAAETDGFLWLTGGAGLDRLTGGQQSDTFSFASGDLSAADRIDGQGGYNVLDLIGDYSAGFTFGGATIKHIDDIELFNGSFVLTMRDANVDFGNYLTLTSVGLTAAQTITFDGSAESDGFLLLNSGDGDDVLIAGQKADFLLGGLGADRLTGGGGTDTIRYVSASESTGPSYDTVVGFDFSARHMFDLPFTVLGVDGAVNTGELSNHHFDSLLEAAVDGADLMAHHTLYFTPDSGSLAGIRFLVIDVNGTNGYQGSADIVIALDGAAHTGAIGIDNFV